MTNISVIICVDVDPDGLNMPGVKFNQKNANLSWRGLKEKIPKAVEILNSVKDSENNSANISWFIRCDEQLKELYGDHGWLFKNFDYLWKALKERGDELAWHPHFWKWNESKGSWNQEIQDIDWMLRCLENGFKSFQNWSGETPSVRLGWAYHNNHTMIKLDELGVRTELSAVPGLKSEGKYLSNIFCDCHDWSITTDSPYFPSKEDYRTTGEDKLRILEIPTTVSRDPLPYALFGMAVDKKFKSPPPKFHLTPLKEPKKFHSIIQSQIRKIKHGAKKKHIGMYFHPTDLISENALKIFEKNLGSIPELMKKEKVMFSFDTAKEATSRILQELS
ncbi:MAG: hypothetical protein JSV09_01470 [Thermoplasmata archaeon]|nr:MAG: hypothetical protein JSV09_01470 [Thermoplasmata archaeon]